MGVGSQILEHHQISLKIQEVYKIIFKRHEIGPKKSEEPVLWDIKQIIEVSGLTEVRKEGR